MKRVVTFILFTAIFACSFSQGTGIYDAPLEEKPQLKFIPGKFIGPGVGVNNISGMIGLLAEIHIYKNFSLAGGAGIGLWGGKTSIQARYYKHYPISIFYGLGMSTAYGIKNYEPKLSIEPDGNTEKVKMDLNKVRCINFSIGQQFRLGRRMRLNFELGYAIPLQTKFYEVKTPGVVLTKQSEQSMDTMTPGGLIVGIAFSTGLK
jgi:hypothetical protein